MSGVEYAVKNIEKLLREVVERDLSEFKVPSDAVLDVLGFPRRFEAYNQFTLLSLIVLDKEKYRAFKREYLPREKWLALYSETNYEVTENSHRVIPEPETLSMIITSNKILEEKDTMLKFKTGDRPLYRIKL